MVNGRRYKLWQYGKGDGVGGVRDMAKEELCEEVVGVRRVSNRVMTHAVIQEADLWVYSTKLNKFGEKYSLSMMS